MQQGVTATNLNVNIVQWFGDNIFGDLQAAAGGGVHPALQVDAIRYLYTFRYQVRLVSSMRVCYLSLYLPRQLTKEQLVSVLPLLLNRLESQEVLVYTSAAEALDRILFMRTGGSMMPMYAFLTIALSSSSIFVCSHPRTCNRSRRSFSTPSSQRLESRTARSARRRTTFSCVVCMPFDPCVLVSDQLSFPGVVRVIITAKQALIGEYITVLQRLVDILRKVAPNPSNTNFDQYISESISGLIRFIGATVPDSITVFESALFPSFTEILQKDIYRALSFILKQLLEC